MDNILTSDIIYFLLALFIFIKVYKTFERKREQKEFEEKIQEKVQEVIEKNALIYGTTTRKKRSSAFDLKNKERLDDLLSAHYTVVDHMQIALRQSGIKMSIRELICACLLGGSMFSYVLIECDLLDKFLSTVVGMPIGMYLIYSVLIYQAEKKKQDFLTMFPDTIDMMIRGVKAGLNISRVIRLVSMEAKEPIASEFNTMVQKMELGVPFDKVFVDAANDIDIEEFRFMSVALVLQMENGGALAEILGNLSQIVRKRLELQLKIRAMSSEARMSAIVLCALPFAFAGIMMFMNPDHLKGLLKPGLGQTLLKVGCFLYFIGVACMLKITKMKV